MRPARAAEQRRSDASDTLVVLGGALGDVVLRLPVLREIGPARVLAPRAWGAMLTECGLATWGDRVDDLRYLGLWRADSSAWPVPLRGLRRAVLTLRDEALRTALARQIPEVLALDPEPAPGEHQAIALLRGLGCGPVSPEELALPILPVPERWAQQAAALWPAPVEVLLMPGSGGLAKCWPRACFAALARSLRQQGRSVLVVLGPDELERGWDPADFGAPVLLAPELAETAALCARAGVVVGNDAGTTHLAAAVGAPVVALFGPTDPARWRPMGPRVRVLRPVAGEVLAPEAVLDAVVAQASTKQSSVQPSGNGSGSGSVSGMSRR